MDPFYSVWFYSICFRSIVFCPRLEGLWFTPRSGRGKGKSFPSITDRCSFPSLSLSPFTHRPLPLPSNPAPSAPWRPIDTLLIDYQFTFSLSQEDDRYYIAINFVATPEEVGHGELFLPLSFFFSGLSRFSGTPPTHSSNAEDGLRGASSISINAREEIL